MVGAGEPFAGVAVRWGVVGFPKEVEYCAVWCFEVGDFAFGNKFDQGCGDFVSHKSMQAEYGAVEVAGGLHVFDVEGDVMDAA